jgi:DNA ligase-1
MSEQKQIEQLTSLITTLNNTKGTNKKIDIISKAIELKELFRRIYDPKLKTGITTKGLDKYAKTHSKTYLSEGYDFSIYELFDSLVEKKITGYKAKSSVWILITKYPGHEDTIKKVFEKKLRIRVSVAGILVAFPGLFLKFEVRLAKDYSEEKMKKQLQKYNNNNPVAFLSDKKDGVRLVIHCVKNNSDGIVITSYSRQGNEFFTLNQLEYHISQVINNFDCDEMDIWLDGEFVALIDGKENFKSTISQMRKLNTDGKDTIDIKNAHYFVFDYIDNKTFTSGRGGDDELLSSRLAKLKTLFPEDDRIIVLPQYIYSDAKLNEMQANAVETGAEGVMISFNVPYKSGRSFDLMKVKIFHTEEYKVIEEVIEDMPFPNNSGGEDIIRCLNKVYIKHKGGRVAVGGGFSKNERIFYSNPENSLIGKLISVQYQEELQDADTGIYSLRMPTFKGVYGLERNI